MSNPNITPKYPTEKPDIVNGSFRKVVIEASTPNDTRLNFTSEQKSAVSKIVPLNFNDPNYPYNFPVYNIPNATENTYPNDIVFSKLISPNFHIIVEKIKICLHSPSTYGCIKLNLWNFGDSIENIPVNLLGTDVDETPYENAPVTILDNVDLISNAIDSNDNYFNNVSIQVPKLSPFEHSINPNSILSFGIQHAEGNAYGLKVYLVGWAVLSEGGTGLQHVNTDPEHDTFFGV